jgi:hypothetical protein
VAGMSKVWLPPSSTAPAEPRVPDQPVWRMR